MSSLSGYSPSESSNGFVAGEYTYGITHMVTAGNYPIGWLYGKHNGRHGHFPADYVEPVSPEELTRLDNGIDGRAVVPFGPTVLFAERFAEVRFDPAGFYELASF